MNSYGNLGISDIDVLALSVRDSESRRLIDEAITAYRGGALRSAIMSTWIAVAYDIIVKARELAGLGETVPQTFVIELEKAIELKDKRKLQTFEAELLRKANFDIELLAPHEYIAFERLQNDRHLCAHPAFVLEDELYQPSPEQVRAHIVHALQYLLVHAPLQGKSAIARFDADLLSSSFPTTAEEICTFLRTRYLDRAKDVLVINLLKAVISAPFGSEHAKYANKIHILALTFREISKAKTHLYDTEVPRLVASRFERVSDNLLLNICPFLENDPRIWTWLMESDRTRIRRLIETADEETLKTCGVFSTLDIGTLSDVVLNRFDSFDEDIQVAIIAEHPSKKFVSRAIKIYSEASSFRHAEHLGQSLILPLAKCFSSEDVIKVLAAASENGQIWHAGGTPGILEQLFDQTTVLLDDTRTSWTAFVDGQIARLDGDESDFYSYPRLLERLDKSDGD